MNERVGRLGAQGMIVEERREQEAEGRCLD
jgi:hypothetical protein